MKVLQKNGYTDKNLPCVIGSFERSDLEYLKNKTPCKTVFLLAYIMYEIHRNPELLKDILSWSMDNEVDGFGYSKDALVTRTPDNHIDKVNTKFIEVVHGMGKQICVYTFQNEYNHMVWDYGQDPYNEYELFLGMGIDAFITDFPATARQFLNWKKEATKTAY